MSTTGYIITSWVITFGAVAGYAVSVLRRGRKLSRSVPDGQRRWM